jgi:ADP-heptose:LPS heptosyltransferase
LFAATHSPFEWMPRGSNVSVMVRHTGCTPCRLDGNLVSYCPYNRRCLTAIAPEDVLGEIRQLIALPHTPVQPGCADVL